MKFASTICSAVAAALAAMPPTIPCQSRAEMLAALERDYGERPVAFGITSAGTLVELLATRDFGTWTLIVTDPERATCVVGAGEFWRRLPMPAGKPA